MWEAIQQNKRRSAFLLSMLGSILALLGVIAGAAFALNSGLDPIAGCMIGLGVALLIYVLMMIYSSSVGVSQILNSMKAKEISKQDLPQLYNVVEEMKIASGLEHMPKIYLIDDNNPNAFAIGKNEKDSVVAITWGLLRRLNRDELQGVIAHEIAHIKNRDSMFLTTAATTIGAIAILSEGILRALWYSGGGGGRRSNNKGGGQAQIILLVVLVVAAILAPIASQLLYFAISRKREYLADASAARFTRYPPGLASALEKISTMTVRPKKKEVNNVVLPMYIINPLQLRGARGLFSTHPPTEERIEILKSMAGASYLDFESAYEKIHGRSSPILGSRTLSEAGKLEMREAGDESGPLVAEKKKNEGMERAREALDMLDGIAGFNIIPCVCGVRIKLPPNFKKDTISCARCGRKHATNEAKKPYELKEEKKVLSKVRNGWSSISCNCGCKIQISPQFAADKISCPRCRSQYEVQTT